MNSSPAASNGTNSAPAHPGYRGRPRLKPTKPNGERLDYFRASFVAYSRALLEDERFQRLSSCQRQVLDWLHSITIAFQREWAQVRPAALERSSFSRAAVYAARRELAAMGFLEFRKDAKHHLWVRLNPEFHALSAELLATLEPPVWPVEPGEKVQDPGQKSLVGKTNPDQETRPEAPSDNALSDSAPAPIDNLTQKTVPKGNMTDPMVPFGTMHEAPEQQQEREPLDEASGVVAEEIAIADHQEPAILETWTAESLTPPPAAPDCHQDEARQGPAALEHAEPRVLYSECFFHPPAAAPEPRQEPEQVGQELPPPPAPSNATEPAKLAQEQAKLRAAIRATAPKPERPKVRERNPLTPEQVAAALELAQHGVREDLAARLTHQKPIDAIHRALAAFGTANANRAIGNPGGWLFEAVSSGRYDEEPAPPTPSEAEVANAKEKAFLPPPVLTYAERTAQRDAALEARRQREAEQERTESAALVEQTARETAALLAALEPAELAELRDQATASFRGKAMPKGVIIGAMLELLGTDQRRQR